MHSVVGAFFMWRHEWDARFRGIDDAGPLMKAAIIEP